MTVGWVEGGIATLAVLNIYLYESVAVLNIYLLLKRSSAMYKELKMFQNFTGCQYVSRATSANFWRQWKCDGNDDEESENNNDDVEVQAVCALFGSTRPPWTGHDQSVRRHDDDSNDGENF